MRLSTLPTYAALCHAAAVLFLALGASGTDQANLLTHLFKSYEKDVRPICDSDEPIEVKIGMAVRQIIELDEPKQILHVNAWLRLTWYDCHLRWNESDYGNISNIIVPYDRVWIPDITLYDNAGDELEGLKDYLVNVQSSGICNYNFPTVIQALCKIDVTYFPFDTQKCPLKFGSWAHHGFEIDTVNKSLTGDISSFVANTEWELLEVPVKRNVFYYQCCPEPYPDVTFYVTIKRKPLFYVLNLLFPCLLITSVGLLGFLLPPDAGEKVSLEITVLLSLAVFLLVVSEELPASSETFPYIGIYFAVAMLLVSLSTLMTVIVLNVHHKGDHSRPVPQWIKTVVLHYIARVLLVNTEKRTIHPVKAVSHAEAAHGTSGAEIKTVHHEAYINGYQEFQNKQYVSCNGKNTSNSANTDGDVQERPLGSEFSARPPSALSLSDDVISAPSGSQTSFQPLLRILRQQLFLMEKGDARRENKHKHDQMSSEWKKVGIVLDRLFLAVFTAVMIISSMALLLRLSA